ncbi:MAG: CHASE3 domain-containing protein [Planctomycetota bacterium]|nr:CHASE3 domain-containing protein [Planctomycetota bacterium]
MNMTIGKKMGLGFGVLLALVATLALVVLFHLANMHRQFSFVIQHDAPVIANARQLLTLVVDMETGQRGFVITGKDEFLEPYEKALASFSDLLNEEKTLVGDNVPQVKLLEGIEASVQEWRKNAAAPEIAMRRKVSEATVDGHRLQEIISQGVGKRLMDRFMALGHEIESSFKVDESFLGDSPQGDWEAAFTVELIEKCMADREDGQRGFLITGKEEFLDKYHAGEQLKLPEYFARLRSLVSDRGRTNELSGKIDRWEKLADEWSHKAAEPQIAARRIMNKHPESLRDVAALLAMGTGKRILDRIREDFRKFIEEEERLTARRFASASQASRSTTNTTILLAFVFVIFGGFMAMKITRGITKPVRTLAGALGMVAKGELSQEVEIKSKDEIGALSTSFNRMVGDLKQLEEDREQSAERLRRAMQAASSASQSKSEFLANMSHEIRTPMTAILGFSDLLGEMADMNPACLDYVSTIKRNGAHLIKIINDILDLSKIEAGQLACEIMPCSPHEIINDVASTMRFRAQEKGLQLVVEYSGSIPAVIQTDPTRFKQALINLVGNAVKFTEQGSVRMCAGLIGTDDDPRFQVEVVDTGIGIPSDRQERIFEPFTQADASTTRTFGGTGLGLTITHRIALLMGGDLAVCSEPGKGSVFSLSVAAGSLQGVTFLAEPVTEATPRSSKKASSELPRLDCRVLLVEDGEDNRRLIAFVLTKAGAEVTVAENGRIGAERALQAADEGSAFDVILMDMQMPVMDGYTATGLLRERGYTGPIIALTAHAMTGDRDKCIRAGCDDFATKPIDRAQLLRLIQKYAVPDNSLVEASSR